MYAIISQGTRVSGCNEVAALLSDHYTDVSLYWNHTICIRVVLNNHWYIIGQIQ